MKISSINITFLSITFLIIIAIGWIIYLNRGGEQILGITLKSFIIPVLIGLGLLFLEFMKPLNEIEEQLYFGYTNDKNIMLNIIDSSNVNMLEGYTSFAYLLNKIDEKERKQMDENNTTDFIQAFVLKSLSERFKIHWDVSYVEQKNFLGVGGASIYPNDNAEKEPKKIVLKELQKQYSNNIFLKAFNENDFFYLPSGSKISLGSKGSDFLIIETDLLIIKMKNIGASSSNIEYAAGKQGDLIKLKIDSVKGRNIIFHGVSISYNVTQKRIKRWSPNMEKELNFAKNIFNHLNQTFDWEKYIGIK